MKTYQTGGRKRGLTLILLGLTVVSHTWAVERPGELDEQVPHLKGASIEPLTEEEVKALAEEKVPVIEAVPSPQLAEPVVIPYLGVGSMPLDDLLLDHLSLEHGVTIQKVHEGSGAAKAGLKKNDILLNFDGRAISSPLDLRDAVRDCKVGDEVLVEFLRSGQKREEIVQLEQRPTGLPGTVPQKRGVGGIGGIQQLWPGGGQTPRDVREQMEQLRNLLDREFNDVGLGLKLNGMLDGNVPNGNGQIDFDMNAESSVTWSDAQGTITMRMKNGRTEVTVRDNNGEIVYNGPWETTADKSAVDPSVRDRIENMGVQQSGNKLKFFMEGLPGEGR